jgi:hypothetical protein
MEDLYATTPLNPTFQEFRFLRVQPGEATTVIRCTLETFPLANHPSYTALSYTWGPNKMHDFIELNGSGLALDDFISSRMSWKVRSATL